MASTPSTRLSFGEHEVWITVDGKELECYGIERNEEKKELTCWIPCEADKPFSIFWQKLTKEFSSRIDIYMDGNFGRSKLMKDYAVDLPHEISSAIISPTEARDFRFGALEITDDDAYLDSSDSMHHLGEIGAVLRKVIIGGIGVPSFVHHQETKKVHERSKRALTHQVKYGEKRAIQPFFCDVVNQEILATFIFKYRPFAMLQANGLVPRVPSPQHTHQQESRVSSPPPPARKRKASSVKQESDDDNYSNGESDLETSLLERLSSFQAELEQIRRKKRARREKRQGGSSKDIVKAEPKAHFVPGEVIDLT